MKSQVSRPKVYVGMSGGVDSSVTAALLKSATTPKDFEKIFGHPTPKGFSGFDVYGVHIKMWSDPEIPCCFKEDRYDAMRVAAVLDIPFVTWDFTTEYREAVVAYMIREYAAGRTPNPDVMCNREIKFGIFLRRAFAEGADYVATGHYVRIKNQESRIKALKAVDKNKDQSYFLWTLGQEQLQHCLFPIGEYTKSEVREMARKFGLPTAEKKDSQGICFIGEIDLREFLKRYIPLTPGPIVTTAGKRVGMHEGLSFYTLGQRQGMGVGGGIPYYVAHKDAKTNTLVVSEGPFDEALFTNEIRVSEMNWIGGAVPEMPFECEARIRYRQPLQRARIMEENIKIKKTIIRNSNFIIQFSEPQRAATSGQSIVFYQGEEMLGGGIIV